MLFFWFAFRFCTCTSTPTCALPHGLRRRQRLLITGVFLFLTKCSSFHFSSEMSGRCLNMIGKIWHTMKEALHLLKPIISKPAHARAHAQKATAPDANMCFCLDTRWMVSTTNNASKCIFFYSSRSHFTGRRSAKPTRRLCRFRRIDVEVDKAPEASDSTEEWRIRLPSFTPPRVSFLLLSELNVLASFVSILMRVSVFSCHTHTQIHTRTHTHSRIF